MDAELQARVEEILAGANRTSSMFAGDERLDTILQANLNSVGLDLAGQLDVGEGVLATAPALVAWAGKSDPGLVIVTARRVLLAWTSGMRSQQVHLRSAAAGGEAVATIAPADVAPTAPSSPRSSRALEWLLAHISLFLGGNAQKV